MPIKKIFMIILPFLSFICHFSCYKNKVTFDSHFIEAINDLDYDESLLEEYYNEYKIHQNIILAINTINYPSFLIPHSYQSPYLIFNNFVLLNTNYYLDNTTTINNLVYLENVDKIEKESTKYINKEAYENYLIFYAEALKNNYTFTIFSAYRSLDYQRNLYENSLNKSYVAYPGFSEHHSGLAIDIGLRETGIGKNFEKSSAYTYLINNIYNYGFILRYLEGKENITGYPYESWHFTYVGKDIAKIIFENNLTLEEYIYQYLLL